MIYASLMLEMFPSKGLKFFKYMHTVRMAASRGYSLGLVNYDEQHRLRKATSPSSSWGLSTWSCGCCAYQPLPRAISVLAMSKDNANSPSIAHTSQTVDLGSTLNVQRRSDTNNSVCRLFNRGFTLPETC